MPLIRLFFSHIRPYTGMLLVVVALQTFSTLAALYLPTLNARIIDNGVTQGDVPYIWSTGQIMLVVAFLQGATSIIAVWFSSRASMRVGRDIRRSVYYRVTDFSAQDINRFGSATLITRNTNDIQQVQMVLLMTLNFMVMIPIMSVGGIVMAIREDAGLSWLVWVSVLVLLIVVSILIGILMPLFKKMQDRLDDINGVVREQIQGIRVVRAFTREAHEAQRFDQANRSLTSISVNVGRVFVLMFPLIMFILNAATAAVLWFGGHRLDAGDTQIGSLTAFLQYLLMILMAVMMGSFLAMMLPRAVVCAGRVQEVLGMDSSLTIPAETKAPEQLRGLVEFRDVSFSYPGADAPVLDGITFTAQPGQTTAIIGATGAGKSTLLGLIPRLYQASSGEILLDGVSVDDMARSEIIKRVAMVPQKPYLFSGTIAKNLRFGNQEAGEEQLWEALRIAQADDFVSQRSTGEGEQERHGLESTVAQGGTDVSGGQRQRLCIARSLVANPKVHLFDDSFSALDVTTDSQLRAALRPYTRETTVIIVAQRVASIVDADQILVLEAGRIVARGTHNQLLEDSETYQEIVASQMTAEEAR